MSLFIGLLQDGKNTYILAGDCKDKQIISAVIEYSFFIITHLLKTARCKKHKTGNFGEKEG